MSQKYLIRIAELERLLSEQAEALRQKDQQLSLVEETEAFLRSALTRAEEKIEEDEREIEHLRAQIEKLRRMLFGNEVLPTLLNPLRRKIEQVSADGAYDTRACYALLQKKGAKATIPPRKNAAFWKTGHPRNEAVAALKAGELEQWKKDSGYHQRSIAETAMYRFKQLIGPKLSLRSYNAQVGEILAGVKVMNKVIGLGMPIRQAVN